MYDSFEPLGGWVDDFRFGTLARSVLASVGAKELPDPLDFFPWNSRIQIVLSPEELVRQSELGMM